MGRSRGALAAPLLLAVSLAAPAGAVPPLVSGDVPTADRGHAEVYLGFQDEETDAIEREAPADELVLGVSSWQEVTVELPYERLTPPGGGAQRGLGDAVVGTKLMFLRESERRPGAALSFECKLDNGDAARGLGSGAKDYDLRLRSQKSWGRFTALANLGRTFVGRPVVGGVRQERRDVWFVSFSPWFEVAPGTALLAEAFWRNADAPGEPTRLAADVGFKRELAPWLQLQGAVGRSLREGNVGGPRLRVYAGLKAEFSVFAGGGRP